MLCGVPSHTNGRMKLVGVTDFQLGKALDLWLFTRRELLSAWMWMCFMERLRTPAESKLWLQKRSISIQAFTLAKNVHAATCCQMLDTR